MLRQRFLVHFWLDQNNWLRFWLVQIVYDQTLPHLYFEKLFETPIANNAVKIGLNCNFLALNVVTAVKTFTANFMKNI